MKMTFNLGLISKYKIELMGLSIIIIMLGHGSANGVVYPFPLNKLIIAPLGTICFFLLSGMGMYYSLSKLHSLTKELPHWYKKRYTRLLLPYFTLSIPFFAITISDEGGSFIDYVLRVTTISFWFPPHKGMWFIAMIIPLYLLSPAVYEVARKLKNQWLILVFYITIIIVTLIIGEYTTLDKAYFHQSIFFFIGMWLAPYIKANKHINWLLVIIISLSLWFIARYIPILKNLSRVLYLFPIFLFIACSGYEYLSKYSNNIISKCSHFLGRISLELYLTHIYFATIISLFNIIFLPEHPLLSKYIQYTVVIVFSIICSKYVNKLSTWSMKQLNI